MLPKVKTENIKLTYLKAFGIILVVLGHTGDALPLFSNWFPYYSFHMPLFIFVSGYFFNKSRPFLKYLEARIRKLILPYYFWNLFFGVLVTILLSYKLFNFGEKINLKNFFVEPWLLGHQYVFNGPAWFILTLFLVQVSYHLIRKFLKLIKIQNEYIITVLFFLFGALGISLAEDPALRQSQLVLIRVLFGLPFMQLGYFYKNKIEKFDKPSIAGFLLLFAIQALILISLKGDLGYMMWLGGFNGRGFWPLLTSITGIWFWLWISDIFARKFPSVSVLRYIGNNTLIILIFHFFSFWVLNFFYFLIKVPGFDTTTYKSFIFYRYLYKDVAQLSLLYTFFGITFPLALKYSYDHYIARLFRKKITITICRRLSPFKSSPDV